MLSDKRKRKNAESIGAIIRKARESHGYTQRALAAELGLEYHAMISQMELGHISVPPALWVPLTNVLQLGGASFPLLCLSEYQPDVFEALFDNRGRDEVAIVLNALKLGKLDYLMRGPKDTEG